MKRLIIILVLILGLTGCTNDDSICGQISNKNRSAPSPTGYEYVIVINGEVSQTVSKATWDKYQVDDYYCFE